MFKLNTTFIVQPHLSLIKIRFRKERTGRNDKDTLYKFMNFQVMSTYMYVYLLYLYISMWKYVRLI